MKRGRGSAIVSLFIAWHGVCLTAGAQAYTGNVAYAEHFAFTQMRLGEGLGGPARQACKARAGYFARNRAGESFAADQENSQIHWIDTNGVDRIIAGDGRRGHRDGPGLRARFDMGYGPYADTQVQCDDLGAVYVSDCIQGGYLRKICRDASGAWQVITVSGGGTNLATKGAWVPATSLRYGCATHFGVSADGSVAAYAGAAGVYKVLLNSNLATLVATAADITSSCGYYVQSLHVGGAQVTDDGNWLYWMADSGGGGRVVRCNLSSGQSEIVAGTGVNGTDDSTDALNATFHTTFCAFAPDCAVIFTGGGDEMCARRIMAGQVKHLMPDGSWSNRPNSVDTWWFGGSGLHVGRDKMLYTIPAPYSWPGWIVRARFEGGE